MYNIDCLIAVPFERIEQLAALDTSGRRNLGAHMAIPFFRASAAFDAYLGFNPGERLNATGQPNFNSMPLKLPSARSTSAVALASVLERAGLSWMAVDPGEQMLEYWRRELPRFAELRPRTVALCTTFVLTVPWLKTYVRLIRRAFPTAKLLVGGYYYASNAKEFLSLDADVMCVGEGEVRFPQIVKRLRNDESLDDIPGLYVRKASGTLHFTGKAEPLKLDQIEPPDWTLAERIYPPVSLEKEHIQFGFETQRGCVFKCQYCTYRTLALPNFGDLQRAVDGIFKIPHLDKGFLSIIDATMTYPKHRFAAFMGMVIDRGGFPCPVDLCARVNDVTEENAALMQQAGVTAVLIGQESGDQGMLQAMQKGTHVSRVRPAIAALGRHNVMAMMSFIHGFPGETTESVRNTRNLIASLNDGFESKPVAMVYAAYPFMNLDLAEAKHESGQLKEQGYFDYSEGFSSRQTAEEVLATFVAVGRIPHAPVDGTVCGLMGLPGEWLCHHPRGRDVFKWAKAVVRGIGIFIERDLEGRKPNEVELRRIREQVQAPLEGRTYFPVHLRARLASHVRRAVMTRLGSEFGSEVKVGTGVVTRLMLAAMNYSDQGELSSALATYKAGEYVVPEERRSAEVTSSSESAARMATELVEDAVTAPPKWIKSDQFKAQLKQHLKVIAS
ncbi:MAG TPA: radical SAM protein [Polyangiaceae bacterium]|nr:radical SAM protein [Polyangiaceae bacterium]